MRDEAVNAGGLSPTKENNVVLRVKTPHKAGSVLCAPPQGENMRKTKSLCPVCLALIEADIVKDEEGVWIEKTCEEHGSYKSLIWEDTESFEQYTSRSELAPMIGGKPGENDNCPFSCGLCDSHRGGICTAVIEVTEECNMQCPICFASSSPARHEEHMPFEEAERRLRRLYAKAGGCSLQFSGGEATLREDLPELVAMAKSIGFGHVQVNSNGIRISKDKEYLKKLKDAGCDLIYLQFDGLTEEIYAFTRGRKMVDVKLAAIENCREVGIGVMLVPVIIRDVNDSHIGDIIEFAKANIPTVKGIHFQPVSFFGRFPEGKKEERYTLDKLMLDICEQSEIIFSQLAPRAKYSALCSFSSAFVLDESGKLVGLSKSEPKEVQEGAGCACQGDERMERFALMTNKYTRRFWGGTTAESQSCGCEGEATETAEQSCGCDESGGWAALRRRLSEYTLNISSMAFQDVWNIDIDRVESCCVTVCDKDGEVPLCLYHLTSEDGRRLYGV